MMVKAALLVFRQSNGQRQLLFVRARNKVHFVFPGGKQEPGESIDQALKRELREELGTSVADVKKLGAVVGATPDGRPLTLHLYSGQLQASPQAHAEIEEIAWLDHDKVAASKQMTPMTTRHVLPFLATLGLW